eukprot:scaffold207_cov267-Pinguiococcus_pyrenoidosus.AAC.30
MGARSRDTCHPPLPVTPRKRAGIPLGHDTSNGRLKYGNSISKGAEHRNFPHRRRKQDGPNVPGIQ